MRIGKWEIIKEEDYLKLKENSKKWDERDAIIEDNKIQKEKERLERKYKNFFGKKYYDSEEGICFEITGIYYDRNGYYNKFKFSTSAYNNPNWDWEVDIDSILNREYEEVNDAFQENRGEEWKIIH